MQDAKNSKWTRITIHDLESGKIFTDKDFEFNPKDYPEAEVIDLR
jgi:outer membrane lipoprotein-sorting protein